MGGGPSQEDLDNAVSRARRDMAAQSSAQVQRLMASEKQKLDLLTSQIQASKDQERERMKMMKDQQVLLTQQMKEQRHASTQQMKEQMQASKARMKEHMQASNAQMQKMQNLLKESDIRNARIMEQMLALQKKAKKEMDPKKYDVFKRKHYSDYLNHVKKCRRPKKTDKFSVAFVGVTCAGKTTLINTLIGVRVAKPSPIKNTKGVNKVHGTNKTSFYDVFGTNDDETYHEFTTLNDLMKVHLVICLYTNSVESVKKLAQLLAAASCKVHFCFSKIDSVEEDDRVEILENDTKCLLEWCPGCTNSQISSKKNIGIELLKRECKLLE